MGEDDLVIRLAAAATRGLDDRLADWRAAEARMGQTEEESAETVETAKAFALHVRSRIAGRDAGIHRAAMALAWDRGKPSRRGTAPYFNEAAAAGAGRAIWDRAPDGYVSVPAELPRSRYVAIRVRGRSMEPLLHDGDVVLVDRDLKPRRGRIVVARNADDEYMVKRFDDIAAGAILLASVNPDHPHVSVPASRSALLGTVVFAWSTTLIR